MSTFILIDIGGTKTRLAASTDLKSFVSEPISFPTPTDPHEALEKISTAASTLAAGVPFTALICGVPGVLNADKTSLVQAANLPSWDNFELKTALAEKLSTEVSLENDATLAGLGETYFGAGSPEKIVAYFTVSTGVGGARIVNGAIDSASNRFEPGHQILCVDGNFEHPVELEQLISGTALTKKYGKIPSDITDENVWNESARLFAYGLYNSILHWSPDIVIMGGFVSQYLPLEVIRGELSRLLGKRKPPELKLAALEDHGGLWGGMAYLKKNL